MPLSSPMGKPKTSIKYNLVKNSCGTLKFNLAFAILCESYFDRVIERENPN